LLSLFAGIQKEPACQPYIISSLPGAQSTKLCSNIVFFRFSGDLAAAVKKTPADHSDGFAEDFHSLPRRSRCCIIITIPCHKSAVCKIFFLNCTILSS
jgi:hypothetical protein